MRHSLELTDRVGRKYFIHIRTQQGDSTFETDNIEDTLISLLGELKQKKIHVSDIRVDRGTLEQHLSKLQGGKQNERFFYMA